MSFSDSGPFDSDIAYETLTGEMYRIEMFLYHNLKTEGKGTGKENWWQIAALSYAKILLAICESSYVKVFAKSSAKKWKEMYFEHFDVVAFEYDCRDDAFHIDRHQIAEDIFDKLIECGDEIEEDYLDLEECYSNWLKSKEHINSQ